MPKNLKVLVKKSNKISYEGLECIWQPFEENVTMINGAGDELLELTKFDNSRKFGLNRIDESQIHRLQDKYSWTKKSVLGLSNCFYFVT